MVPAESFEQSSLNVMARILSELASEEGMGGPLEASGAVSADASIEQTSEQMIEEVVPVEQPLVEISEATAVVASSFPREQIIAMITEHVYQTPPATKSTRGSTVRFYERIVVKASRSSPEASSLFH